MRRVSLPMLLFALACGLPGCTVDSAPLIAKDVVIMKPTPDAQMGAGYLALTNTTDQAITISKVTSPEFASVEMHQSYLEDGISRMRPLATVTIPPDSMIVFERGAKHLMLMGPTASASNITLQFYADDALILSVNAPIEE